MRGAYLIDIVIEERSSKTFIFRFQSPLSSANENRISGELSGRTVRNVTQRALAGAMKGRGSDR